MESGAGPLLVLVHGAGGNHTSWRYQARWLARHGYRVNALDLPGHGGDPSEPLASVEAIAAWVADLVKEPAVVIGHSLGGLVCLELAGQQAELLVGLVLIGSASKMPVHPELAQAANDRDLKAVEMIIGRSFDRRGRLGGHPDPGISPSLVVARTLESELSALGTDLEATANYDGSAAADRVSVPSLVVGGNRDRMVGKPALSRLGKTLDRSRTAWLDCGHMVMTEAPDQLRLELSRYLAERRGDVGDW